MARITGLILVIAAVDSRRGSGGRLGPRRGVIDDIVEREEVVGSRRAGVAGLAFNHIMGGEEPARRRDVRTWQSAHGRDRDRLFEGLFAGVDLVLVLGDYTSGQKG
jgi:hypothetical protein